MPDEKDPKSHYSYEEMVERLRENRSPGSKVKSEEREVDPDTGKVTVRRQKKRRTGNGKSSLFKDSWFQKIAYRLCLFGIPILAVLAIVAYIVVAASVGTTRFQDGLGDSLARQFGLPVRPVIKDVSLRGLTLKVEEALFENAPGEFILGGGVKGAELRLTPSCFLGGNWTVEICKVARARVVLGAPQGAQASRGGDQDAQGLIAAGFLLSENPGAIHFKDFNADQIDVLFGSEEAGKTGKAPGLYGVRASLLERTGEDGTAYFDTRFTGGRDDSTLVLPGWVPFRVNNLQMELRSTEAVIKRSMLHHASEGESEQDESVANIIEAKGTIPYAAGGIADIELKVNDIPLTDLLPKSQQRILSGVFQSGSLHLTFDTSNPSSTWRVQGPAMVKLARVKGIRLINQLQIITGGEMDALDFDECHFVLDMSPKGTRLTQIETSAARVSQLKGDLLIAPRGELDGKLQLGIAQEALLENSPAFFKPGDGAVSWTPVAVDGTAASPSEDLSARIQLWLAEQQGKVNILPEVPDEGGEGDPGNFKEREDGQAPDEEKRLQGLFDTLTEE